MVNLDQIQTTDFTVTRKGSSGGPTFLPEPERRPRKYTVISVDDHIVEPPDMFEGRVPSRLTGQAPHVVTNDTGSEVWVYDGEQLPNVGFNAVAGRPVSEYSWEPTRFDEMRRGAWDIDARVRDMDINGVYASVSFPSFLAGFSGYRLQLGHDADLALAVVRAWNEYHLEVWAGRHPGRIIPLQIPWLLDPAVAAQEIRRNAELGFRAVSFTESPDKMGLPSLYSDYWDPFFGACQETETVVCLHFGSSGTTPTASEKAPPEAVTVLFGSNLAAAVDWLFAKIPLRFPGIKLCLSEGGIGWVPALLDRLDHMRKYEEMFATFAGSELTPTELVKRNFWFCAIDEPSGIQLRHRIGIGNIVVESDYPHADSTWPDTQAVLDRSLAAIPADEAAMITWKNASELFRHPVPAAVQADPEAF
jgi:predicted TIM-barrel fold metal-dependent hydrolase